MATLGPHVDFGTAAERLEFSSQGHRAFGRIGVIRAVREESRHGLRALRGNDAVGSFAENTVRLVLLEKIRGVDHDRKVRTGRTRFGWRVGHAGG